MSPCVCVDVTVCLRWQEAEQKRLESEMQKRRERIEQWRTERKKTFEATQIVITPASKKWSLEDDDDEEEPPADGASDANGEENDIDPLDAYMQVCVVLCSIYTDTSQFDVINILHCGYNKL